MSPRKVMKRVIESEESIERKSALIKELATLEDLGAEIIYVDNETRHDKNVVIYSCKDDELITELYPNIFSSLQQTELILEDMPIDEIPENKVHSILNDENDLIIECKICFEKIQQKRAAEHADSHELKFSCEICGWRFSDQTKCANHKEIHNLPGVPNLIDDQGVAEKYFKGEETRTEFDDVMDFVGYKIFSHKALMDAKDVECQKCHLKFKDKPNLLIHTRRKHDKEKFHCKKCRRQFLSEQSLNIHIERNDCTGEFKCLFCEKVFNTKQRLKSHTVIHARSNDLKMIKCDDCGREFLTVQALNVHQKKIHDEVKNSLCPICGLALFDKAALVLHMRTHDNDRPFKCDVCEATFRHKFDVVVHNRLHTGERPFQCKFCDQRFIANTNMTKHLKAKHNEEYEKSRKK